MLLAPLYRLYAWRLWQRLRRGPVPSHLALIMDGNRRYAQRSGLRSLAAGYAAGADRVDDVLEWCERAGIPTVTLWAVSLDNLKRPDEQLQALSSVIEEKLQQLAHMCMRRNWRLRGIGRLSLLPQALQQTLEDVDRRTEGNRGMAIQVAIGYGGREEVIDALRTWSRRPDVAGHRVEEALRGLSPEELTPYLYAGDQPEPDLILRTSGELRLSGFLLWQSVYAEYYFTDVLWPEFREVDFLRALRAFQARRRRYGL
jgi:short-chain Z-isoprenyl diphosphate synthase